MFGQRKFWSLLATSEPAERALFDAGSYLKMYPDIAMAGVDPFDHYMTTGWREGRHPSALFNVDWYCGQFPSTQVAEQNPLTHYRNIGGPQGFSPTPLFDAKAYARFCGRVPGPDFIPLIEFLKAKPEAGFNPCPLFHTDWFLKANPAVAASGENYLLVFAREGARQGMNPSPDFDCSWYLRKYSDVAHSLWNPLAHYLAIGQYEGRNPRPGSEALISLIGAHEEYGEYSAIHIGEAVVIGTEQRDGSGWSGSLAVHLHIFYGDMMEQLAASLKNIAIPFSLFISAPDTDTAVRARRFFATYCPSATISVRCVPNRGRDLAPMLVDFAEELRQFDILIHLHSKKSLHTKEKRDWPVQMLHHLMASENHTNHLLGMFADDPELGLAFPVYHPSLRGEIGWGGNRPAADELLGRIGSDRSSDICCPFPAGSFFVIRTALLQPLWELGLTSADFEEEQGAVDGTLAHAVERILGFLPTLKGMRSLQVRAEVPHSLSRAWLSGQAYTSPLLEQIESGQKDHVPGSDPAVLRGLNVVIYSCATHGYDVPLPAEHVLTGARYHFFADRDFGQNGIWQVAPLQISDPDPVRQARLHKASPHILFPDADIAIWIDGNIAITGDLSVYLNRLLLEQAAFGLVRHSVRNTFIDEARALARLGIDRADVLAGQIGQYLINDAPVDLELAETNFMVMDLRMAETIRALDLWRDQLCRHSIRDQVSFDYVRWRAGAPHVWLFDEGGSVRSNPRFAYFPHGGEGHTHRRVFSGRSYGVRPASSFHDRSLEEAHRRAGRRSVDVIIPVHNAQEDVCACLQALNNHRDAQLRLILVDDGSDEETAAALRAHARDFTEDVLIRHDRAMGFSGAANAGLRGSTADVAILLNSDTIVAPGAVRKLVAALERNDDSGIAGPLSNAASWQSVPEQVRLDGSYIVNALPENMSISDVAAICERLTDDPHIAVPALNGFCLAIRRDVIERIGFLDEAAFPEGYGEETDYCFRAADRGFLSVVASDSFVFHAKSKSFGHPRRRVLSEAGYRILLERYGSERLDQTLWMLRNTARLQQIRAAFRNLVIGHERSQS